MTSNWLICGWAPVSVSTIYQLAARAVLGTWPSPIIFYRGQGGGGRGRQNLCSANFYVVLYQNFREGKKVFQGVASGFGLSDSPRLQRLYGRPIYFQLWHETQLVNSLLWPILLS